jgi:hypothetical protein
MWDENILWLLWFLLLLQIRKEISRLSYYIIPCVNGENLSDIPAFQVMCLEFAIKKYRIAVNAFKKKSIHLEQWF